jgi:hypothetical protein
MKMGTAKEVSVARGYSIDSIDRVISVDFDQALVEKRRRQLRATVVVLRSSNAGNGRA